MTFNGILCLAVCVLLVAFNEARPDGAPGEVHTHKIEKTGSVHVHRFTGKVEGGGNADGGNKGGDKGGKKTGGVSDCITSPKNFGLGEKLIETVRKLGAGVSKLTELVLDKTNLLGKLPKNLNNALLVLLCDTEKGIFRISDTVGEASLTAADALERLLETKDLPTLTQNLQDALKQTGVLVTKTGTASGGLTQDTVNAVKDTLLALYGKEVGTGGDKKPGDKKPKKQPKGK